MIMEEEEEHEVYGGDIPEMEGDVEMANATATATAIDDDAVKVLFSFCFYSWTLI